MKATVFCIPGAKNIGYWTHPAQAEPDEFSHFLSKCNELIFTRLRQIEQ